MQIQNPVGRRLDPAKIFMRLCVCGWFCKTVMLIDVFSDRFSSQEGKCRDGANCGLLGSREMEVFALAWPGCVLSVFTGELTQRFKQQSGESDWPYQQLSIRWCAVHYSEVNQSSVLSFLLNVLKPRVDKQFSSFRVLTIRQPCRPQPTLWRWQSNGPAPTLS